MHNYPYLIVGGGMAADAAVGGIRQVDGIRPIGMIGAEVHPPYSRPPLSKGLWKGKPLNGIWRRPAVQEATIYPGRTAVSLDLENHRVVDDQGTVYGFQKLLLATGGTPRRLPSSPESVIYYRSLDDYHRLRRLGERQRRFAVIGGGFIGSEIAAALAGLTPGDAPRRGDDLPRGRHRRPRVSSRPGRVSQRLLPEKGVQVRAEEEVLGIDQREGGCGFTRGPSDQREDQVIVDGAVAGLGIRPNVELAQAAGLAIGDGIRVDASLRTSHPDVFAAGDVAEFFNPALATRLRVEHEDNANTMGDMAGRSMAGESVAYEHLPFFYSDLFELGYEAVGQLDARLETVANWWSPIAKGRSITCGTAGSAACSYGISGSGSTPRGISSPSKAPSIPTTSAADSSRPISRRRLRGAAPAASESRRAVRWDKRQRSPTKGRWQVVGGIWGSPSAIFHRPPA